VNAVIKLALHNEENGNYPKAIGYYNRAIGQLEDIGEWSQVLELKEHVADLLEMDGQYEEAIEAYDDIEEKIQQVDDSTGLARVPEKTELIQNKIDNPPPPATYSKGNDSTVLREDRQAEVEAEEGAENLRKMAEDAEESQDYEQSLYYFKEYLAMEQKLAEEKRVQELVLLEKVNEIENRDREIILLKQNEEISSLQLVQNDAELKKQIVFKRNLAIGLILLATLVFTLYLLYRNKRRDHRKLGLAYNDLETTRDKLKNAQERIEGLLHQQVSGAVANELLAAKDEHNVERRFVCIMFLDIRDFTPFAEKKMPEEIIDYQNRVFGFMIDTINRHHGIVNQILGDGFMATFGAPVSTGNDCLNAFLAAKEIISEVGEKSKNNDIPETRVGIGLHAGYVVAGNVGTDARKQYSITGNTVILASRLEQLNKKFGSSLVISKEAYSHLPGDYSEGVNYKSIDVKGRSTPMEIVYF